MKLEKLFLSKTASLAPMAGVADRAFREICIGFGAAYVVGEMASSKGMQYKSQKTNQLLEIGKDQRPAGIQLFGDDPETMAQAAVMAEKYEPDFIDINMGCPAPKVAGAGSGSALLKDLPLAGRIIKAVTSATQIPVTVKIRIGWDNSLLNGKEAALCAQENGAQALTVHGRTRAQMYSPPVDINAIAEIKKAVDIPVVANGDVDDVKSMIEMYEKTECDFVMIGRGALGAPWVFSQIKAYREKGIFEAEPSPEEKLDIMLRHIKLACKYKGEKVAMKEARKHVAWYLKGWHGAAALRNKSGTLTHFEDLEKLAAEALENITKTPI